MRGRFFLLQLFHAEDLSFEKVFILQSKCYYRATAASVGQKCCMGGLPMRGRFFSASSRVDYHGSLQAVCREGDISTTILRLH